MAQYTLQELEGQEFLAAGTQLVEGAKAGLWEAARAILALSLELTPEETGTLRRSARVDDTGLGPKTRTLKGRFWSGNPYAVVGYGYGDEVNEITGRLASQYAVPVHEKAEYRHEPPTQSHFLQTAMDEYAGLFEITVGEMMVTAAQAMRGGYSTRMLAVLDWAALVDAGESIHGHINIHEPNSEPG